MHARDPSTAPNVGDRVAYVICKKGKNARVFEQAEDPIYALQNEMELDFDYYVEKQLRLPVTRIFEPIISNTNNLFAGEHTRHRFEPRVGEGKLSKYIKM